MSFPRVAVRPPKGLAALVLAAGCFTANEGLDPPQDAFYYPTGLAVSPGGTALYVANSDFDLHYNGGTVQVLDLAALRTQVTTIQQQFAAGAGAAAACAALGLTENDNRLLSPGPCSPLGTSIKKSVTIGAFASNAIVVPREGAPGVRLFVPVRGDPSITFFDVSDDRGGAVAPQCDGGPFCLECAVGSDGRCGASHRIGEDASENLRHLELPVEPVGLAASEDGAVLVSAHETEAAASLIVNGEGKPTLQYYTTGMASGPTGVAAVPVPEYVRRQPGAVAYAPGFLVSFRAAAELHMLRFNDDALSQPPRPFLTRAAAVRITANSVGDDSRGIVVDDSERRACEEGCGADGAGQLACLLACIDVPLRFFVANRAPASLLIGRIETRLVTDASGVTAGFDELFVRDSVPLAFGASRVALGHVIDPDGVPRLRVFAAAFDSRLVFSYDPEARRVDAIIGTGRGPHALALDTAIDEDGVGVHSFLYVGHFTDSYLGVVDLDMRKPTTFGSMIATVGVPTPPRSSQ